MTVYILEAVLDGIREKHSYLLCAQYTKTAAISCAEEHCNLRGGKYSVLVFEVEVGKKNEALDLPVEVYRAKGRNDNDEYFKDWVIKKHGLKA